MLYKNQWKNDMTNAVRTMEIRGELDLVDAARLVGSIDQPIKEQKPHDLFTAFLFQKANQECNMLGELK